MNKHKGLLLLMPGIDGLKTGFTNASGYNLAASGVRDGHRLITVVLGGPTISARDNHVADLLNIGFDVMRRRDRGETITVAQSLFEPQMPAAPVQYAANDRTAQTFATPAPTRQRDLTGDLNTNALRGGASARGGMRPVENPPEETQQVVLASIAPVEAAAPVRAAARPAPARPPSRASAIRAPSGSSRSVRSAPAPTPTRGSRK
jgi:D-alanyl-D-alanine carboxypeptidase